MWRPLRTLISSDVVVTCLVLLLLAVAISAIWLYLAWLEYNERYGLGFLEYIRLVIW